MEYELKSLLKMYYGDRKYYYDISKDNTVIKVSHNENLLPYGWLHLDENKKVIGNYISHTLYDIRVFNKINNGDTIIF